MRSSSSTPQQIFTHVRNPVDQRADPMNYPSYYCGWLRNPAPVDRCFVPWFIGFQHVSTIIHSISHSFQELMMNMAKTFTADFTAPKNSANLMDCHQMAIIYLIGGVEHLNHLFMTFPILGMSSSQLTNSYFSEGLTPPTRYVHIYIYMYKKHYIYIHTHMYGYPLLKQRPHAKPTPSWLLRWRPGWSGSGESCRSPPVRWGFPARPHKEYPKKYSIECQKECQKMCQNVRIYVR